MPFNERPNENLQDIRRRLEDAKRRSDKLLSLKLAEQTRRQLLEQDARDAEERLKKKSS